MPEQKISLEDLDSGHNLSEEDLDSGHNLSDNTKTIFSLDKFNKTILNTGLELLVLRLSNDKWYKDAMQILVSVQICKIALLGQITWAK